ncbi:molybdate transport system substrate-binding protein [Paenibacillus jamilae]|jgi:molybdate transport system substrate-binding protein|uniref:molybdate ABC transporter substrate-binding protein n=1 Tax=Paenibacillus TaxID=44249 RepID=UPI0005CF19F9|nr:MULTISPECIES: molybdate ABC transporter substrate-binding protein [Paenibacillus]KAF6615015.1 molybdate ABC transporter substrate-binding protein [Paenibacillus sp. EKM101P]KAF6622264.1 molybdate ABC transporter substrate-binding protein [Paenibacillus sp. EKM102P]KAF6631187.1 molybdate ABC transporter substrate-binding protein [Paenibacillus sp. EKM10P]KAF6650287.1 molybdate ABC transporter substrate-binding protein [Paenibacillus sp. EKM11P]KJD38536.1 molybdenum ABC transporter substrate-
MKKIIKHSQALFFAFCVVLLLAGCGAGQQSASSGSSAVQNEVSGQDSSKKTETVELTISAAASLTDALKEIQTLYESSHKGIQLNFNFGGSGALEKQIEQGAPSDLFLSASKKNMKSLVDQHLIESNKQKTWLTNELVAVIPADGTTSITSVKDLMQKEVKKVAIGIPESVPAGKYAQEALTNIKLWDVLQDKLVQAKDVRQVLQYVETGNADVGFVYKTDALTSQKAKIAFEVDSKTYSTVEYPIGIIKASKHIQEAESFYEYLQSQESLNIMAKYGFTIPK